MLWFQSNDRIPHFYATTSHQNSLYSCLKKYCLMIRASIVCVICFLSIAMMAQDSKLANEYYRSGEYEQAAALYKKIWVESRYNEYYFDRYIESLLALEDYDQSLKEIKTQLKRNPKDVNLYVVRGKVLERQGKGEEAEKQYAKAVQQLPKDHNKIRNLANAFNRLTKYELALKTYKMGEALLNQSGIFSYQIADIYKRLGNTSEMIHYYLLSVNENPNQLATMKNYFSRTLTEEDFPVLKEKLFVNIQDDPDNVNFPELLEWVYIQEKDYKKALRQAKALDLRLEENGTRVFNIGMIASNDGQFDTAIGAYQYVIDNKGINSSYYLEARQELLSNRKKKVVKNPNYSNQDLLDLQNEYISYLSEIGKNKQSAFIVAELANLEAYYMNDLPSAINRLNEMIEYPGVNKYVKANGKISLADFYLIQGEIWEATLLYSQVDKDFKEDYLGEKARYRNALLSYYNGDFQWAQKQFDVLKASTSKLISNDAIDKSVFIMDNLALDTSDVAISMYAEAELMTRQNKYAQAFNKLDSLATAFPDHSLVDDIYYQKAILYRKQKDYDKAVEMYMTVIENHNEEIRCDNSIFELAEMYEMEIGDIDKAQELYEKLFLDYSNSVFAIEARKKYRSLRGDNL